MRRIFSLVLVLIMMLSLSLTAFAAEVNDGSQDTTIDVKAIYNGSTTTPDVISVDITWGEMQFTYSVSGTKDWDSVNHEYKDNTTASWTASGNTLTFTNHSNVAIKAELSFTADTDYSGITGSFDKSTINLASGDGLTYASADSAPARLTLSGKLANDVTSFTKVGTITVKIGKQ